MTILKSFALTALCAVLSSQIVSAQELDPGRSKVLGEAMQGHQHATYQHLVQQRAQIVYYNSQSQEPIPVSETQQLVMAVKRDLTASDAALANIKAKHANEPEVLKQIAVIEKHHAKAQEDCAIAEKEASKDHADQLVIGTSSGDLWHEMDAAQVETQKLLKMLKIDKLEPPKKVVSVKSVAK